MSDMGFHCKLTMSEAIKRIEEFRAEKARLPGVSMREITENSEFSDMWAPHVKERRKWYELTCIFNRFGWERRRHRSLSYLEGKYIPTLGSRWYPPIETPEQEENAHG